MDSFLGSSVINKIAILQPNYIPWKGYFDLIAYVDHFVILDDVQFTKRDWRNRNLIKTSQGTQWITVPVISKGKYDQKINEVLIDGNSWRQEHLNSFKANYSRAKYFEQIYQLLEPIYLNESIAFLSNFNLLLIETICVFLNIETKISLSSDLDLTKINKNESLIEICNYFEARTYVSGPAARNYLDITQFKAIGLDVEWFDYDGYNIYEQLWGEFEHKVSILDLLFNCGANSSSFLRYPATKR